METTFLGKGCRNNTVLYNYIFYNNLLLIHDFACTLRAWEIENKEVKSDIILAIKPLELKQVRADRHVKRGY